MNHREATDLQAAERYLLDQLTPAEQSEFEEHYFGCADCAAEVEAGAVFAANARAVLSERSGRQAPVRHWWMEWRRPACLLAAAGVLLLILVWDEMLRIPGLKRELARLSAPQSYPAFFLRPVARGDDQVLAVSKTAPLVGLTLDVPPGGTYRSFECEIRGPSQFSISVPAPASPGTPLNILVPQSHVRPGPYLLILRGQNDGATATELSRFSFSIQQF